MLVLTVEESIRSIKKKSDYRVREITRKDQLAVVNTIAILQFGEEDDWRVVAACLTRMQSRFSQARVFNLPAVFTLSRWRQEGAYDSFLKELGRAYDPSIPVEEPKAPTQSVEEEEVGIKTKLVITFNNGTGPEVYPSKMQPETEVEDTFFHVTWYDDNEDAHHDYYLASTIQSVKESIEA